MKQQNNRLVNTLVRWEVILLLIFIAVIIINSNLSPYFLDLTNILDATLNFMEKAIIALPMMFVILCGDIDISVASIMALSSVFMGLASQVGAPTPLLIFIGLITGLAAGFFNGIIITRFKIPAIAVTIGTMSLYRGIGYVILGDKAFTEYPDNFSYFGMGYIGNTYIPIQLIVFIVLAVFFGILLHKTTFGRKVYAIGNNATTARFSGINTDKIRLIIFSITGLCSGLASILFTSRIASTRPNIAYGWELEIITTVVLGGVAITGGSGNIFGVLIAIFMLGFMRFGLGLVNMPSKVMNIVTGFLLIIAIMLPGFIRDIRNRHVLREQQQH